MGIGGGIITNESFYSSMGQLIRSTSSGQSDTLYAYNDLGEQFRSGQDIDGDHALSNTVDRISESDSYYLMEGSEWWRVSVSMVYATEGSSLLTTNSIQKTRLTGLGSLNPELGTLNSEAVSADLRGNQTISQSFIDRANKTVTQVMTYPDSTNAAVSVSVNGLAVYSKSKTGLEYTQESDALGRRIGSTDPRTGTAYTHYNDIGQVDWVQDAASNRTFFVYSPDTGRQIAITNALGKIARFEHDARGNVIRTWGETEYPLSQVFDDWNRVTNMATYRGGTGWGNWDWPADPGTADNTVWLYDAGTGLMTNKLYADGKGPSYSYTPEGRLQTRTWARGISTTYSFTNTTGELVGIDYSDSTPDVAFVMDRLGRQVRITDGQGIRDFGYDEYLVLVSETLTVGGQSNVLARSYDSQGRQNGITAASAAYHVSYGFDSLGRFSTLVATNSGVQVANLQYTYVPGSDLLSGWTNSVAGTSVSRSYEANRDLLTQVRNMGGQTTISEFNYSNDALGRRTARIDSGAAFTGMVTNDFGYNTRNELTSAQMGTSQYGYAFDPIGNRTASTNAGESFAYEANQLNQYTQIVDGGTNAVFHDPDGNLTNDGQRVFSWDAENRLICVEPLDPTGGACRIRCAYDYMSRRIEKAVDVWNGSAWVSDATNKFVWDGWLLISETIANQTSTITNRHVWGLDLSGSLQGAGGIGGLICRTTADAGTHYYTMDGNGNVSDVVDATGTNVLAHYEPGPFGEPRLVSGTLTSNPWQFSTKYWDFETGLGYWGYRYYDPIHGRWLSRDPIEEDNFLLLYSFVGNDGANSSDALGLLSLDGLFSAIPLREGGYDFSRNLMKWPLTAGVTINLDGILAGTITRCGCAGKGLYLHAQVGMELYLKGGISNERNNRNPGRQGRRVNQSQQDTNYNMFGTQRRMPRRELWPRRDSSSFRERDWHVDTRDLLARGVKWPECPSKVSVNGQFYGFVRGGAGIGFVGVQFNWQKTVLITSLSIDGLDASAPAELTGSLAHGIVGLAIEVGGGGGATIEYPLRQP